VLYISGRKKGDWDFLEKDKEGNSNAIQGDGKTMSWGKWDGQTLGGDQSLFLPSPDVAEVVTIHKINVAKFG